MQHPQIVSRDEWTAARKAHLAREKELTRLHDQIMEERRALPWVRVDKDYVFETSQGRKTLAELFAGRSQLIVYHFMWRKELGAGCVGCSFLADHIDGANQHLEHHDVTLLAVARAPLDLLQAYRKRMGWQFDLVSSAGSDFNFDYHVSFTPEQLASGKVYYNYQITEAMLEELSGLSVFVKGADGAVYHTYSGYSRAGDIVLGAHNYLDFTPKGRNEATTMDWVRRHDEYEAAPQSCCGKSAA
jgi:predicted dithiol-disulfide oxidoreductase (DUF899 family)